MLKTIEISLNLNKTQKFFFPVLGTIFFNAYQDSNKKSLKNPFIPFFLWVQSLHAYVPLFLT
jgi:hypothetical protein